MQLEIKHPVYSAPIVNSKRSKLGKREITGGVEVNLAEIPANVLNDLLSQAIIDFLQVGLKTVDQDKATTEECQAAMNARLDILKAGATTKTADRKPGAKDPIIEAAKKILKKTIQDMSDEKIDSKELTKAVNGMFKDYRAFQKSKSEDLADVAKLVQDAIDDAKADAKRQEARAKTLVAVVAKAREAATAAASEAKAAKPAAVKPTDKVKAEKSKAKPAAR